MLGEEHPNTLTSVNNLAFLYVSQGRFGEAEPLYRQALTVRERVLGEEHPNTLISVNNLAFLYQSQGRYGEAGANQGIDGGQGPSGEDGILYALEAQDLNLGGTQLVTLSACETGRGALDSTDGVYGLVRSFQLAGAENVLMTLWQLDDALAAEFMADFYRNWLSGKGLSDNAHHQPADALRATQLAWINSDDERRRNPYHWAPYVVVERR